jgi:hypothetical protein
MAVSRHQTFEIGGGTSADLCLLRYGKDGGLLSPQAEQIVRNSVANLSALTRCSGSIALAILANPENRAMRRHHVRHSNFVSYVNVGLGEEAKKLATVVGIKPCTAERSAAQIGSQGRSCRTVQCSHARLCAARAPPVIDL